MEEGLFPGRAKVDDLKKTVQVAILEEMFQGGGISLVSKDSKDRFVRDDGTPILKWQFKKQTPLPAFNEEGDLPPGVHRATLSDVLQRFGQGTAQRRAVADRLTRIYHHAASTGQLARFVVFGSFVTTKDQPNDVDIVLLMEDGFDLASVTGEAALVFQHMAADAHFGASVFWTKRSGAIGGEQAMIEYWQVRREGGRRGIVEIVGEKS